MDKIKFPLNNLITEIVSEQNIGESFDYVINHLEIQKQRERYRPEKADYTKRLIGEISAGTFRISKF